MRSDGTVLPLDRDSNAKGSKDTNVPITNPSVSETNLLVTLDNISIVTTDTKAIVTQQAP